MGTTDIQSIGFGQGFSKEVEAILEVADRGLLYPREIRENLQKAGFIIYEDIQMPDVPPPAVQMTDEEVALLEQFIQQQQAQEQEQGTDNNDEEQEH